MKDLEPEDYPEGLIFPLDKALANAKRWRDPETKFAYNKLHGFYIPHLDLAALTGLAESGASGARAYLGIDENNNAKLVLVGTISTQHEDGSVTYDDMLPGMKHTGKVYDFSMPCPRECSSVSPFNDIK
ncbi:hypothetical protein [Flavobacterium psychrotrophum]|uniref:hypothetical protein n=1 Tax=Flavobacterium psychrotrophum TaxID=2294119 RepID=UPI000E3181B1|nr:hypothetical protein [Flavobacterium psychrotrophum]